MPDMTKYDASIKTSPRKNLIVVRTIILDEDNKILLVKRSPKRIYNAGLWELPGGKLVQGMDLEDSAQRAILKEIGMQIRFDPDFYHAQSRFVNEEGKYKGHCYLEITFIGTSLGGKVSLGESGDLVDFAWIDRRDVFSYNLTFETRKSLSYYVYKAKGLFEKEKTPIILVARSIVRNDSGKVLLLKRSSVENYPSCWEFPGGKLGSFENMDENIIREVFEETGLIIQTTKPAIHVHSLIEKFGKYRGYTFVTIFSESKLIGGQLKLSKEHEEAIWIKLTDIDAKNLEIAEYLKMPLALIKYKLNLDK